MVFERYACAYPPLGVNFARLFCYNANNSEHRQNRRLKCHIITNTVTIIHTSIFMSTLIWMSRVMNTLIQIHGDGSHSHEHGHVHSSQHTKAVLNRMSRIIGHMESTKRMVEDGRDCSEVLIQLSAIESAIKSVSRVILKEHMSTCIIDAVKRDDIESIEELNKAIDKFIR